MFHKPESFFSVIVDDFFDEPEKITEYGKSLPKTADYYPGFRSKNLWEINVKHIRNIPGISINIHNIKNK